MRTSSDFKPPWLSKTITEIVRSFATCPPFSSNHAEGLRSSFGFERTFPLPDAGPVLAKDLLATDCILLAAVEMYRSILVDFFRDGGLKPYRSGSSTRHAGKVHELLE